MFTITQQYSNTDWDDIIRCNRYTHLVILNLIGKATYGSNGTKELQAGEGRILPPELFKNIPNRGIEISFSGGE